MSKRWTEEHGYELVRQWRRSGQSMAEFARTQGYNEQRVPYWRERAEAGKVPLASGSPKLLPGVGVNVAAVSSWAVHRIERLSLLDATRTGQEAAHERDSGTHEHDDHGGVAGPCARGGAAVAREA